MVALFKKSTLDYCDPTNYHPMFNIPFLGKITNRVALKFLDDTLALDSFQVSFHAGYGMVTALDALKDDLHRWVDLTAALDMFSCDWLAHCLANIGICGVVLQ